MTAHPTEHHPRPRPRHRPRHRPRPAPADRRARSPLIAAIRGLLGGLFFGGLATLYALVPPSPDQFELTYVAWRLNAGDAPYAGVVDMNWPGAFWLHQLVAWLPQGPLFPWRVLDFALMLAGLAATARWLRPRVGAAAAWAVLLGYPIVYADPRNHWFAGQRDAVCFHLVLVAAAAHLASLRRADARPALAAGAVVACALLVKPLALVAAPALLLHGLLSPGTPATKLGRFGRNAAGGLAVLGFAALGLGVQGAPWRETVEAAWSYNRHAQSHNAADAGTLLRSLWTLGSGAWWLLGPVAAAGLVAGWARTRWNPTPPRELLRLAWILLAAGVAFYALQGKGFGYHAAWVHGVVVLAALATAGVAAASAWTGFARGRMAVPRPVSVAAAGLSLACLVGVAAKASAWRAPAGVVAGTLSREAFLGRFPAGVGTDFAEAEALARELAARVPAGEDPADYPVLVFADEVSINLLSGRPLPTAFYYPRVLIAAHHRPALAATAARWDARFAAELAASDAEEAYVSEDVLRHAEADGVPAAATLHRWLAERYRPAGRVGGLLRYERRHPTERSADPAAPDLTPSSRR